MFLLVRKKMNDIKVLWMTFISFQLLTDHIICCNKTEFSAAKDKWRKECIHNFCATFGEVKSIGILYKEEVGFQPIDFIKLIASRGISSSIFQLPIDFNDLIETIMSWKSNGIQHVFFLQKMDQELLELWMQILEEICDGTWWLFYAEEKYRNLFASILSESNCYTDRWVIYSTEYSTCQFYSKTLNPETFTSMIQSSYKAVDLSKDDRNSRKIIRLAVRESPPYLSLNKSENGTIMLDKGPDAELLRVIANRLKIEYEIVQPSDGEWGRIKRGNWTGLIGMLVRNEADMASGCITVTHQRFQAVSFSFPYDIQKSVLISKIPGLRPKTYAVLLPFTLEMWLMILSILVFFWFLLYGVGKLYGEFYLRKAYKFDRIFWFMIGSMCSEGGWLTFQIQGTVTVLVLGLWLLFVIVMQASYCGTLMSVLTFPSYENSIDTLPDLARAVGEKGFKCGCLKGTINCDALLDLKGDLKVIADALESDRKNFVRSVLIGLNKVLDDNFVFVAQEVGSIYRAQLMPEPNFYMSTEGLDIELFSITARNGFPFLRDIDKMILRLLEAGIIVKWRDDLISINNMDFETRKSETIYINPLSLTQLTGAIYMFSYGLTFAFVTFIFEYIGGKYFCKKNFKT